MDKEVHEAYYRKYNGMFCACASSVYQAFLWGGGAWGRGCDGGSLPLDKYVTEKLVTNYM